MLFVIGEAEQGWLVRDFLRAHGVSAALSARLKRLEDGILLNGTRVTVRAMLQEGDRLELAIEEKASPSHILPRELPVSVLLERESFLVANKAADMPTHPSHGHFEDTLANALAYRYTQNGVVFRPRFINRLDRNTTGCVLVARHALAAARLSALMAKGEIRKTYLALVEGEPREPKRIETGIRRREKSIIFREVCPIEEGDPARTFVEPICGDGRITLVRLTPYTGRTHQLRVHMASIGHPLLGDDLYGGDMTRMRRHALHAAMLRFPDPESGTDITVRAPLPADMTQILGEMGEEVLTLAQKECEGV